MNASIQISANDLKSHHEMWTGIKKFRLLQAEFFKISKGTNILKQF
jgi:hypothetical protein